MADRQIIPRRLSEGTVRRARPTTLPGVQSRDMRPVPPTRPEVLPPPRPTPSTSVADDPPATGTKKKKLVARMIRGVTSLAGRLHDGRRQPEGPVEGEAPPLPPRKENKTPPLPPRQQGERSALTPSRQEVERPRPPIQRPTARPPQPPVALPRRRHRVVNEVVLVGRRQVGDRDLVQVHPWGVILRIIRAIA